MIETDTEWFRAESTYSDPSIGETTIPRMFFDSADRNGPRDAQWYKGGVYDRSLTPDVLPSAMTGEFAAVTYAEMADIVRSLAVGFRELGVERDDRVGIYADTRMEWAQSDLALLSAGATVTTVYTESSAEQTRYLLDDPDAVGVVCEDAALLDTLVGIEGDLDLEFIVVIDEYEGYEDRDDILSLADVYERGREAYDESSVEGWIDDQSMDELASLIYTSGTTGKPKGVKLTHRNFRANVNQVRRRFADRPDRTDDVPTLGPETRALSFLPLAHVYERTSGHFVMFASGATVAYAESTDTVADDLATVRPTSATSVPRIYERVFATMREQASGSDLSESIFEWAVDVAREYARSDSPGIGLRAKHALADRLVYSSVKETMGGNVEMFISGGGSLSQRLAELFEGMGLPIHEGYGLTETAPVVSTNPPDDLRSGTLGPPLADIEAKLDPSVVSDDQRANAEGEIGELLLRGPNVTDGYWNRPDATDGAFTDPAEGEGDEPWFRSGDIVETAEDGYLVYHDRLKQLIVLDTGKNIAPGPIEDEFATSERIAQAMIVGDDEKFIAALFVPDTEALERWAERNDLDLPEESEAIATDERVREWVRTEVDAVNESLASHEQIKEFRLIGTEWTPDNDMLTPSMKLKRRNVLEAYDDEIEAMYGRD